MRTFIQDFIYEFSGYFRNEPPAPRLSRSDVLMNWLNKVTTIRRYAIQDGDINAKIRCDIIVSKLVQRISELHSNKYLA